MNREPRPLKRFGQNFLKNPILAQKIADALVCDTDDTILEIGPGPGTLTRFLVAKPGRLIAVEFDERWIKHLQDEYGNKIEIRHQNILDVDFEKIYAGSGKRIKVIGNIPYNITSPILFKLLDNCCYVDSAVLMMQKEVAARLTASINEKAYGILTVAIGALAEVEKIITIGRKSFLPQPKVDSTVLRIKFSEQNAAIEDEKTYREVIRGVFNQRRKMLANSLKQVMEPEQIRLIKSTDLTSRPEQLTVQDFIILANEICGIRKKI